MEIRNNKEAIEQLSAIKAGIERIWVRTYEECLLKVACANDIDTLIKYLSKEDKEDGRIQHD